MSKFLRRFNILIFSIIFLFSLAFRVANLDLIEFKTDEAVNLLLSARPALYHTLPPGGTVSSIGILNPPLFNYLLAPLTFFTLDPKIFSFLIGSLNSIAIAFFYLIVKKYYGQITAFTSSTLFAFSPWAILYSRKIWTQDLLIPFFILMFYSLHKIYEKKQRFWILFASSSLFLIQLHQTSIFFIGLISFFMFFQKVKLNLKYLLIGGVLGIIPLLPYLNYETKNGYPDFKALSSSEQRLSSKRSLELFFRPLQITSQGNFSFILGADLDTFVKKFPLVDILRRIFYFEYIFVIVGSLIFLKKFRTFRIFPYSVLILPAIYFLLKIDPFMHYYIIILPFLFLFLGATFEFLFKTNKLIKSLSLLLFLSLVISSLAFNFTFFKLLGDKGHFRGDYGDSLKASQKHIKNKSYDELFLFQFIPLTYSFGYNPFAKIVYSNTSLDKIPTLEKELQESGDIRIEHELLAFYTKEPPTLSTLDILRKKTRENPKYNNIYKETLNDYLARNYKKEYIYEKFDLRLFYPQHWKIQEENGIKIEGDYLVAFIQEAKVLPNYELQTKKSMVVLNDKADKIECIKNKKLCGVSYSFKSFSAIVSPKGNNEAFEKEVNAMDSILSSMRFISE